MNANKKILVGIAAIAVAGLLLNVVYRKKTERILSEISNEGYETALDVLYPDKPAVTRKLKYGPVLPA